MSGTPPFLPAGTRRLVILGGSFDPVHEGHLAILEQGRRALGAEAAWLLPTGEQPLRSRSHASPDDRLAMAEAAVRDRPGLGVCDLEARRPGPSYTIDTAAELAAAHPDLERWWLLGADAARHIREWRSWQTLVAEERFGLVNRTGVAPMPVAEAAALGFLPERTRLLELHSPPLSASAVRERLAAGASVADMLPAPVAALIRARGLYGAGAAQAADNAGDDLHRAGRADRRGG